MCVREKGQARETERERESKRSHIYPTNIWCNRSSMNNDENMKQKQHMDRVDQRGERERVSEWEREREREREVNQWTKAKTHSHIFDPNQLCFFLFSAEKEFFWVRILPLFRLLWKGVRSQKLLYLPQWRLNKICLHQSLVKMHTGDDQH